MVDIQAAERHLTHHVAHELQNSIGAVSVYLDLLADDVADPDLLARISKIEKVVQSLREQVDVLRHVVPRMDGVPIPLTAGRLVSVLQGLFGASLSDRISAPDGDSQDRPIHLGGAASILFYFLYDGINHLFAADPVCSVTIAVSPVTANKGQAKITVLSNGAGATGWTQVLQDPALPDVVVSVPDEGSAGFGLLWPLSAL